ncbi:MAG: hypothetical protein ACE5JS_22850, partial [Nitrospinota bacterium]
EHRHDNFGKASLYSWNLTSADPNGEPVVVPAKSEVTVHIYGTWGTATAGVEGSLVEDPRVSQFVLLGDQDGVTIAMTADGIETVLQNVYRIRPVLSTPGSGADVTAYMLFV